ncbi:SAM-dependent methyltransferase [Mangrovihabitans endophyticus]|uniref:S-adenosyl methyltransferase n=1 Tax=Mangrovihabitans endophyticus TaxID=1751298 RepID=A0A8J3BXX1_9ACTN|nr:SAM-dependent methyltransferase [Mangrovihabitans endophyticus]GGK89829.1 hypothetical protein GCM10012284_24770 [Mangrovihabitans endophyticus]
MRYGPDHDRDDADETEAGRGESGTAADFTRPQAARRYNYWLGGKDNLKVDRDSADTLARLFPDVAVAARENRRFLRRVVRFLADDLGVRQFLDIGVGYPSPPDVHDIAQAVDPRARVLYVDHDPVVGVHARALMCSSPEGVVDFLLADLREPAAILHSPQLHETLDLDRPVAMLLVAVLHFLSDEVRPHDAVRTLVSALAPGSYLAVAHGTTDFMSETTADAIRAASGAEHGTLHPRPLSEISSFLDGLTVVAPGLVPVTDWHPEREPQASGTAAQAASYGAVARIP